MPTDDIEMCESRYRNLSVAGSIRAGDCGTTMEFVMKFVMPSIIVVAALMSASPAFAQIYDPHYPICMHVYGEKIGERMDCTFNSLDQCTATASGLPATCLINPYYADARTRTPPRQHRKRHR